ncbi:MAG: heparan-alpha-glucosaminide N-acetyltransferase domain-containing protein [Bacteroidota bacterium]
MQPPKTKNRIESIDILRGIVMVIMALDHVRDFFHTTAWTDDPLNLETTTPALFLTRWITHFCAPIFVFLSGTSIFLQGQRKSPNELFKFLIVRGLWLIFAEVIIITFAMTFNHRYSFVILQVIWTIGISMVILAFLQKLPSRIILVIGLIIVLGHNLLDAAEAAPGFKAGFWWDLMHHSQFAIYPISETRVLAILYPFVPWLGLMLLGYCFGIFFTSKYSIKERIGIFIKMGIGVLLFFVALRASNLYGDPFHWAKQDSLIKTVLSFIKVNKYPPSLLYMSVTIGFAILVLPFLEKMKNGFTEIMRTFGRVAFFYYIIHWFILHSIILIYFYFKGHNYSFAVELSQNIPFMFVVPDDGLALPYVYLIWAALIFCLYPICKWYDQYKTSHPEKWWLSYL